MIKNQLTIYRKFATQQILFEESISNIEIPVPSKIKSENITCSEPFSVLNNSILKIFPRKDTKQTREVIIHYPNVFWQSHYQLFKCQGLLKSYASIYNESNFDFHTNDIKLVFRSMDHEYDPKESTHHKHKDIPTLETKNILEYQLSEILPDNFILSKFSNLLISEQHLGLEEIYQVNILDEYSFYADAYLSFHTKETLLPGTLEILIRTHINDLISAGGMDIKLYHRNERMKIYFPQSKFIKLKHKLDKKNHSFFLTKKQFQYECKIKSKTNRCLTKIHFYLNTKDIQKFSREPTYKEGNIFIWEHILKKENHQHSHCHTHTSHEHSDGHFHSCKSKDHEHNNQEYKKEQEDELFQLEFFKE
jgi:hypothetical protein